MTHNCCNDYTRSQLLRRPRPRRARACRRSSRGCRSRPGPASRGAASSPAAPGSALAVYGASKIPLAAFEDGIAAGGRAGDKILVSVFFDGGIDALSVLAPVGDPRYAQLRPNLALPRAAGTPFSEDDRLQLASRARRRWRRCTARAR